MKNLLFVFLCLLSLSSFAQKNYLLIGRNTGTKMMEDSNSIRTFGFARNLNENPGIPGPTLYAKVGDSVKIDFWNISQGASHTIHLHGLDVDQENDGVPHLSFTVEHMQHGYYRFKGIHPGAYLYHCHVISPIHVQAGMYGMVIIERADSLEYVENKSLKKANYTYPILFSEVDTNWHLDSVLNQGHNHMIHRAILPKYQPQFFLINGEGPSFNQNNKMEFEPGKHLIHLANIGNYYIEIGEIPQGAKIVNSDGRDLEIAIDFSTGLKLYPGERYDIVMDIDSSQTIEYYYKNLNTDQIEGMNSLHFKINQPNGINQNTKTQIQVYPNPGKGQIELNGFHSNEELHYEVYSLNGARIQSGQLHSGQLNLEGLKSSSYFILVYNSSQKYSFLYQLID